MSYVERHTVAIRTAADGSGTGYTPGVMGRVMTISYTKHPTNPYTDGVDFTVTSEVANMTIWSELNVNASKTISPREQVHSTAGVGLTYDGVRTVCESVGAANERIKIVIASGGDAKDGTFNVLVG